MKKRIKKAIFPVGGLGTRFLPATKCMPKEMLPVVDKPIIQYAFEEALEAGIEMFIFITGRNKNIISNHFDHVFELQRVLSDKEKKDLLSKVKDWLPKAGQIAFIRQQEPLGLGHAVYCAKNFIGDEPFAILLADEMFLSKKPVLKQMIELYQETEGNIVAIGEIPPKDSTKYGVVSVKKKYKKYVEIDSMVEKPNPKDAPSNLAIAGRYILQPEIFSYLNKTSKGSGGEIQLTDAMSEMLKKQRFFGHMYEGRRYDCGDKEGFIEANLAFALDRPEIRRSLLKSINNLTKIYK